MPGTSPYLRPWQILSGSPSHTLYTAQVPLSLSLAFFLTSFRSMGFTPYDLKGEVG